MKQIVPVIAVMVAMLSTLVYITTRTIAPDYHFELKTDAVSDVEILFDDMAVPHIYAESETDAMHALGYVHAMERLWQDGPVAQGRGGELSALLGPDMIENDKYSEDLGMGQAAKRTVERIRPTPRLRNSKGPCRPTSTASMPSLPPRNSPLNID